MSRGEPERWRPHIVEERLDTGGGSVGTEMQNAWTREALRDPPPHARESAPRRTGVVPVPRRPHFSISASSQRRPAPTGLPRAARTGPAPTGLPRGGERLGSPERASPKEGRARRRAQVDPWSSRAPLRALPLPLRVPEAQLSAPHGASPWGRARNPVVPVPRRYFSVSAFQHFSVFPKAPAPHGASPWGRARTSPVPPADSSPALVAPGLSCVFPVDDYGDDYGLRPEGGRRLP